VIAIENVRLFDEVQARTPPGQSSAGHCDFRDSSSSFLAPETKASAVCHGLCSVMTGTTVVPD
jgi:hypothetical protein